MAWPFIFVLTSVSAHQASLPVPPLGYEPLCDAYIVHETCRLLNGGVKHEDGDRWTSATGLTAILSASPENINTLWQELRLDEIESGDQIPCMDLCLKLVEYLQGHGTCPPGSDISCYNVGVETFCDLDLRPAAMKKLMQHDGDSQSVPLRHSHGSHDLLGSPPPSPPPFGSYDSPALKAEPSGISYELWEAVERTANLFRIYPAPPIDEEEEEEENESEEIKLHQSSSDRMDRPAGMMARGDLLQAGSCPDFAALREADEDGDCVCPEHTTCHDGPTVGCPTKSGRASKIMFDKDCETCTCETPLEEPASKESSLECPSSAAIRRPDPDGDCFCGQKLCMQGEEQGCTWLSTKDFKHFPASCSDCRCVDAT